MSTEQQPYQPQQQPQLPVQPLQQPEAPSFQQPEAPVKKSAKLPIILMVWPAAVFVLAILIYALTNMMFQPVESELFGNENPIRRIVNTLVFVMGAASAFLGPISFVVGLVMLIKRKK